MPTPIDPGLRDKSDAEVALFGHTMPELVQAEFARRQTVLMRQSGDEQKRASDAMVETAKATRDAAKATQDTAKATKDNATYMLWSVLVLAAASILNLIVTLFQHH